MIVPYVASYLKNNTFLSGTDYMENQIPILKILNDIDDIKCHFTSGYKVKFPVWYQKHNFLALFKLNFFLLKRLLVKKLHIPKSLFVFKHK